MMHKKNSRKKKRSWQVSLLSLVLGLLLYGSYSALDVLQEVRLPQSDHPAELYSNHSRHDLRHTLSSALEKAKTSIVLVVYTLTDTTIINTLKKKAEEGVDVLVVYDAAASHDWTKKKLGKKVRVVKRQGKGLMHQKIIVIDGIQTWVGSANMTTESLKNYGNLITAIQSEDVATFVTAKAKSLEPSLRRELYTKQNFLLGDQKMEVWFLPDNKDGVQRILDIINQAKKSIRIAMFTWTRRDFAKAVVEAHQRGVKVEVVMDHYSGKGASALVAEILCRDEVPLFFSRGNALLHYKMLVVDDEILVNGSANWTKAAFTQNDDCFIILHDLTTDQREMLDTMWNVILLEGDRQTEILGSTRSASPGFFEFSFNQTNCA